MKTKKIHHAWLILVVTLGIMGGLVGILLNCTGIIFTEIIKEFGFRSGDLSIYYSIRSLMRALALSFVSGLFFTKNPKKVLIGFTVMTSFAYMSMAFYTQLWQWYISAVFIGIGTCYTGMAISVLLANWFHAKKGLVMGLAMSSSGVFGALISPLCSVIINASGWRSACIVMGVLTITVTCVPAALFLVMTPEEIGMKPYGFKENTAGEKTDAEQKSAGSIPSYIFFICILTICLACLMGPMGNQLPLYSAELGYPVAVGAMITSFSMMGNVAGKLLTGRLADKIGPYKAVTITFLMVIASMVMFIFCTGSSGMLYAAALLYGTIFSVDANVAPLIFMDVYGSDYTKRLKNFNTISFAIGTVSSSLLAYIYDYTKNFNVIFIMGILLVSSSLILAQWLQKWVSKNRQTV